MTRHLYLPIITFIFCFFTSASDAQDWTRLHPNQDIKQMVDISVGEDGYGWAVGNDMIYYTSDAGQNWEKQESNLSFPNGKFVFYIEGSEGQRAYMVSGQLYETTNAGVSWAQVDLGDNNTQVREMALLPNGNLLIMGTNKILLSTDDGQTWTLGLTPSANLASMSFVNDQKGWATSDSGILYRTIDGGVTWNEIQGLSFSEKILISFVDENLGFVNHGKDVYKTEDGGITWQLFSQNAFSIAPKSFEVADDTYLYAARGSRIYYSVDGGESWSFTSGVSYAYTMEKIHVLAGGRVWVAGTFGAIIYSENPTGEWTDQLGGVKDKLYFVKFFDENIGLSGGADWALIKTTDGGNTWQDLTFPHDNYELFTDALFLSENEYLLSGKGTIFRTTDGGLNWEEALSGVGNSISKIAQTENGAIFASTQNGRIYRSVDNGDNWEQFTTGVSWLNSIFFVNNLTGYAVGKDGVIIKTADGGDSWQTQESGSDKYLSDVAFFDENTGFVTISGWSDSLLYTADGGESWGSITMPGTAIYRSLQIVDDTTAYVSTAAASSGTLYKTTNAGQSWELFYSNSFAIFDIETRVMDQYLQMWISGDGGLVEYWTDLVLGTTPVTYAVQAIEVYPNPSDGRQLTINWPENIATRVQLSYYNSFGQLLGTQNISTDQPVISFGSQLSAGIYFFKITDIEHKTVYSSRISVMR